MAKKSIIIIGSGLAAAVVCSRISPNFNVRVITTERDLKTTSVGYDIKLENNTAPGLGGTTKLWHNALIKIADATFKHPPNFVKYYDQAYELFGLNASSIEEVKIDGLGEIMAVPRHRVNMWEHLDLEHIQVIRDHIVSIKTTAGKVTAITSATNKNYQADLFIDCTGGLGSITHLSTHFEKRPGHKIRTKSYEDHLCAYIASVKFDKRQGIFAGKLQKGWTYRRPLVGLLPNDKLVAFYFRPTVTKGSNTSPRILLSQIRNGPKRLSALTHILFNPSEVLEALSARFGFNLKTRRFEVFAVLATEPTLGRVILSNDTYILEPHIIDDIDNALKRSLTDALYAKFSPNAIADITIYPNIKDRLDTGAHHSATFPASISSPYFNETYQSRKATNFYAVSGGQIAQSGYSNTGLTICAMALELAEILNAKYN